MIADGAHPFAEHGGKGLAVLGHVRELHSRGVRLHQAYNHPSVTVLTYSHA